MTSVKYSLENSETIKIWAYIIQIRRMLMVQDELYLDELFLISTIYNLSNKLNRPVKLNELTKAFNILTFKRDKMLNRMIEKGFINNDRSGPNIKSNGFKLIVTSKGEQLLIKYDKALRELAKI